MRKYIAIHYRAPKYFYCLHELHDTRAAALAKGYKFRSDLIDDYPEDSHWRETRVLAVPVDLPIEEEEVDRSRREHHSPQEENSSSD